MQNQEIDRFITEPLRAIDEILAGIDYSSVNSGAHKVVNQALEAWVSNPTNISSIPTLGLGTIGQASEPILQAGSLVRFRGMIQDTSFGQEVYISRYASGQELKFNAYRDHNPDEPSSENEQELASDFGVERTAMEDRDLWYAVSTPGLTSWAGQGQGIIDSPSIRTENPKYPTPGQPHIGVVLKLYGLDPNNPPAGVSNMVDVVGVAGLGYSSQDYVIHVIGLRKMAGWGLDATYPWINPEIAQPPATLFQECIQGLGNALGGDNLAAEYLMLQIMGRTSERAPDACRFNSLNLVLPEGFDIKPLMFVLDKLVPILSCYNMTISSLNSDHLMPRFMDDDSVGLLAGRLQLPSATFLVLDETSMSEGQLNDCGVKNIQGLTELAANSRLPYIYPYFQTSIASNMSILALSSRAKSLIPSQVCIQVSPARQSGIAPLDWVALRNYIQAAARPRSYTIPQEMADVIQNNFVDQRQRAWSQVTTDSATPSFTHEDLERQLLLARLITLSLDSTSANVVLNAAAWERAMALHNATLDFKNSASTEATLSKSLGKLRIDSPPPCR